MMKRKKDQGFTLIELMIVIAVIGILAVVLVPKVGAIKTQARTAGLDTNIRMVQGYVQSRISSWNSDSTKTAAAIVAEVAGAVTPSGSAADPMKNPFDNTADAFLKHDGATGGSPAVAGEIYITSTLDTTTGSVTQIDITALDSQGQPYKTVTVTP